MARKDSTWKKWAERDLGIEGVTEVVVDDSGAAHVYTEDGKHVVGREQEDGTVVWED